MKSLNELASLDHKRSTSSLKEVWEIIEPDILFHMGLYENINVYISVDYGELFFSVLNEGKEIFHIEKALNLHRDNVFINSDLTVEINLTLISSLDYHEKNIECIYYYYHDEDYDPVTIDEGTVNLIGDFYFNLNTFINFKTNMLLYVTREMQFAVNRLFNKIDIHEKLEILEIDAIIEQITMYSKIHNISFNKCVDLYFDILQYNKKYKPRILEYERLVEKQIWKN